MGKITSITRQVKNQSRVSIFVDGDYFGALDEKTFVESGLKAGDSLDEKKWEDFAAEAEKQSAFNKAIAYISKLMRSEKQVRKYLAQKGYDEQAVDSAIEKMVSYGYIDDESYAKMVLSHQINVKKAGVQAVEAALIKNGIPQEIISDTLLEYDDETQFENAKSQYEKISRRYLREEDERKRRQKIAQSMARKGFSWDAIKKAERFFEEDF